MSTVTLIDHMGTDLTVVNAARVSHAKHTDTMRNSDERLLRYLARNGHWTPFAHPQIMLHVKCNLAVAAQLKRHQAGLTLNEVSRRYVSDEPEFDLPEQWRKSTDDPHNKQGSGEPFSEMGQDYMTVEMWAAVGKCAAIYDDLIQGGVAPEQARLVLPMATVTEFYWTGSLAAFSRVCVQRLAPDAQPETREVASDIAFICAGLFPRSWAALMDGQA